MLKRVLGWCGQHSVALYRAPNSEPRWWVFQRMPVAARPPPAPMPLKKPKRYKANLPSGRCSLSSPLVFSSSTTSLYSLPGCFITCPAAMPSIQKRPHGLLVGLWHFLSSARGSQGNRQGVSSKAITLGHCGRVERSFDSSQMCRLVKPPPTYASSI